MAEINTTLTENIEIGAVRRIVWDREIVRTDGGQEVRNTRWAAPLRSYEISMPSVSTSGDLTDYNAVLQVWEDSEGGTLTFTFHDWVDDEDVVVRFDSELQISSEAGHLRHIDTFTLQEVRD
jgi:hypothetical protein